MAGTKLRSGIEADELHLAGQSFLLERRQHAHGVRLADGEKSVEPVAELIAQLAAPCSAPRCAVVPEY